MVKWDSLPELLMWARHLVPVSLHAFLPNLVFTIAVAIALAAALAGTRHVSMLRTMVWLLAMLVPLAYTWTEAAGSGTAGCHWGQPPWDFMPYATNPEITRNIALMVPAGAAAWLWPTAHERLSALVCALAAPTVIEFGQYLVPQLHRACQAGDIINNMMGALLGWSMVAGFWAMWTLARGPDHPKAQARSARTNRTLPACSRRGPAPGQG